MLQPGTRTGASYDVLLVVHGYEPRSVNIAERLSDSASQKWGARFETPGLFAFDDNAKTLQALGFELIPLDEFDLASRLRSSARKDLDPTRPFRVGVDISSMSRALLAETVLQLNEFGEELPLEVDFWYSPPKYDEQFTPTAMIESAGLINPSFAGFAADPMSPVAAVIGVGYEPNLALGVSEYLDVSSVHAFVPYGHDRQFDKAVDEANSSLFFGETPCRRAPYNLTRPAELYVRLESLTYGLARDNRVALVPLGPKVFGLSCMLVALNSPEPIAIWRFSGGTSAAHATQSEGDPILLTAISSAPSFGLS